MAYLSGYEYDVFISYAPFENRSRSAEGWVSRFRKRLYAQLLKDFGEEGLTVWPNPGDTHQQDPHQTHDEVRQSAVLVPVLSNHYVKSPECTQEVMDFCEEVRSRSGHSGNEASRIVPVLVRDVPEEQWPEPCREARVFSLCDTKYSRPLDPEGDDAERRAFEREMDRLVERLHTVLESLREEDETPADDRPPADVSSEGTGKVFLATTTDDLRSDQRSLRRKLENRHVTVADPIPPPEEEKQHTRKVEAAVKAADLCVHLLGPYPGRPIHEDDPERTYMVEQVRIGLEHASSQLVLLSKETELDGVKEASYRNFLKSLNERPRSSKHFQLIRTESQQMIVEVRDRLREMRPVSGPRDVFIDVQKDDLPHAADLFSYLAARGIMPLTLSPHLSPSEQRKRFEENFQRSQLYVLVLGNAADTWAKGRLETVLKLVASQGHSPRLGVYLSPPRESAADVPFRTLVDVMDNTRGFDPQALEGVLRKLDSANG